MEIIAGVTVSVTTEPLLKFAEQLDPQLIPPGLDVTVPPRRPFLLTVNVTSIVNALALVAVPPAVVTLSGPVVAPTGTVATIVVADVTVKVAGVPLNRTAVVPVKFAPLMVTPLPTTPLAGEKVVTIGAGMTVKLFALDAVPSGVVTTSRPEGAPAGTAA